MKVAPSLTTHLRRRQEGKKLVNCSEPRRRREIWNWLAHKMFGHRCAVQSYHIVVQLGVNLTNDMMTKNEPVELILIVLLMR